MDKPITIIIRGKLKQYSIINDTNSARDYRRFKNVISKVYDLGIIGNWHCISGAYSDINHDLSAAK